MRKRARGWIRRGLAALLCVTVALSVAPGEVRATTKTGQIQQEIDDTEEEKGDLEGRLDDTQSEIDGLRNQKTGLEKELYDLNQQLMDVSNHLADLEAQIADKEQEIADTQAALAEARIQEAEQYESMTLRVRDMYEMNDIMYLEVLFSAGSFKDFLNLADFMEKISEYDQKMYTQYQETRRYIESEESRLEQEMAELEEMKEEAEEEQARVNQLIEETSRKISQYSDQISDAEQQALEYEAQIKKLEEDLEYLHKKLEEELAKAKAAAQAVWRDISEITFAEGDRKLLANLIYCEAGGEPEAGKLAVGAVVINRVRSSVFPNTVVGVIYQRNQFSPVASGRLELALSLDRATPACYKAADDAMAGLNNVGNCVFFRTPIEGLTGISIGGHIFY